MSLTLLEHVSLDPSRLIGKEVDNIKTCFLIHPLYEYHLTILMHSPICCALQIFVEFHIFSQGLQHSGPIGLHGT